MVLFKMNNLKHSNIEFFNYIFPDSNKILYTPKVSYDTNNILFSSGVVYGSIGSGKSELFRSITEKAVKKYGIENVNSSLTYKNLRKLIRFGTKETLINLLMCDDITLSKIKEEILQEYFFIRHYHKKVFNVNNGYILSILGVHRFHGIKNPELRTNLDFLIVKSLPTNPYDYSILKKFIGKEGIKTLTIIEEKIKENIENKRFSLYWLKNGKIGILELPLATHNYINIL